jgi:gliding motility-associated-like protein
MQLTLNMVADNLVEGTEQLKLKATVASPYTVTSPAAITIPEAPVQVLAVKTADAAEPATNGAFVIKLSSAQMAGKDVNVTFKLGGTAGASDWNAVAATAVIKAGSNSVTIPVKVKDDKLVEGDETVTLALLSAKMGTITFPVDTAMQTVVLKDDENNAAGRAMMVERLGNAAEPSQNGSFRIRFSDAQLTVMQDVQIAYSITGSATAGTDYKTLLGTATIPAGKSSVAVNVVPIDDQLVEDTEFVHITLQNVTSSMTGITWPLAAASQTDVPVIDNDTMKLDMFSTPPTVTEGEQVQITIKSPSINTRDIPVALKVVHDAARTITTSVGSLNGNGDTLTVTLPAGSQEYTFTITCFDNSTNDDEGFVFLQIVPDPSGNVVPNYVPGLASEINVIVEDNDPLELSFNAPEYRVNEGNKAGENIMMLEVKLNRASSRPVTLPYQFYKTSGVSFIGAAIPGVDYDSIVKPIEIEPGELIGYIPVAMIGDSTFERSDTFSIRLLQPSVFSNQNVPVTVMPDSAIGIILNDDPFCPTCDTDGDGVLDGKEDRNGNSDPTDDDADNDGIPNYMDLDSDNDGVPDSIEGWITDGRWVNNNGGKIRVHAAVSPNGDGMGNDAMYIENIDKYPKNDVVIFNRWGGTVYKTTNYNNEDNNFKGLNNNGKEVTDGSYFYLIHIYDETGKAEQYTGFIVIKRK